jgi:DNA modification methylase
VETGKGIMELNKLYHGDCLDVMKGIDDNSIDLICTDPPYQLSSVNDFSVHSKGKHFFERTEKDKQRRKEISGFMGKKWDILPSVEIWKECFRVLKPGAFGFVMCTPRQDSLARMICNLKDAGFVTSFSSFIWAYASGFTKAQNISKAIDKQFGAEREVVGYSKQGTKSIFDGGKPRPATIPATKFEGAYGGFQPKPAYENILVVMKPLETIHRADIYKKMTGYDYYYTQRAEVRAKNGKLEMPAGLKKKYSEFEFKDKDIFLSRLALNPELQDEEFIQRNGSQIILKTEQYKNTELTTFATQALMNGHGITWLGEGRIPIENIKNEPGYRKNAKNYNITNTSGFSKYTGKGASAVQDEGFYSSDGRFAPNLLVSDNVLDDGKAGQHIGHSPNNRTIGFGKFGGGTSLSTESKEDFYINDSDSFSRYFDLDLWFAEKLKKLPLSRQKIFPFIISPKPCKAEKNEGCEGVEEKDLQGFNTNPREYDNKIHDKITTKNSHPTVKSLTLMSYLISIGSAEGEIVLDPFAGSATTGLAAKLLNRKFICIEKEEDYYNIALARLESKEILF